MKQDKRFIQIHKEGSSFSIQTTVLVDRQTGINYLFVQSGYGGGLTPLLDRDGKPIVTTVPPEEI